MNTKAAMPAYPEWRPIETSPKDGEWWLVWSAYYQRPVVVTCRMDNNTYWEGDWEFDVEATHWLPLPPPPAALEQQQE